MIHLSLYPWCWRWMFMGGFCTSFENMDWLIDLLNRMGFWNTTRDLECRDSACRPHSVPSSVSPSQSYPSCIHSTPPWSVPHLGNPQVVNVSLSAPWGIHHLNYPEASFEPWIFPSRMASDPEGDRWCEHESWLSGHALQIHWSTHWHHKQTINHEQHSKKEKK